MDKVNAPATRNKQEYIPGVCNIGPAERAQRRKIGIIFTLITIILLVILVTIDISPYWRLIIFLPATAAASGFLQDAFHFCAGFGMKGIYNVINSAGITDNIDLEEFRQKDRHKALMITGLSAVVGLGVAALSLLIRI